MCSNRPAVFQPNWLDQYVEAMFMYTVCVYWSATTGRLRKLVVVLSKVMCLLAWPVVIVDNLEVCVKSQGFLWSKLMLNK